MAQKQKLQNSGMQIPDDAILRIAQAMLPLMQQYFESEEGRLQRNGQTEALEQKEAAPALQPAPPLIFAHYFCVDIKIINPNPSLIRKKFGFINNGDPYGNRTHVTAVKGRCLNRLSNGPGSGNLIRTDDIPGMNRLLYQLSYAAMWSKDFGTAEISFIIVSEQAVIVKMFFRFFGGIFGNTSSEVKIHGFSQEMSAFLHRRRRLRGAGAALAGIQPYQHVRGRRGVLSAHRAAGAGAARSALAAAGDPRRGDHHHGGAGGGAAGEPALPDLGLPRPSRKFSGADMPCLYPAVDSGRPDGHGIVPVAGLAT